MSKKVVFTALAIMLSVCVCLAACGREEMPEASPEITESACPGSTSADPTESEPAQTEDIKDGDTPVGNDDPVPGETPVKTHDAQGGEEEPFEGGEEPIIPVIPQKTSSGNLITNTKIP